MVATLHVCLKYYNLAAMLYIWLQYYIYDCNLTTSRAPPRPISCARSRSLSCAVLSRARDHTCTCSFSFSLARSLLLVLSCSFSLARSRSRSNSLVLSLARFSLALALTLTRVFVVVLSLAHVSLSRALVPTRVCTRSRSLLLVRSHSLSFSLVPSLARFSLANALTRVLVPVLSLSLSLSCTRLSLLWVSLARSLPRVCVLVILLFSFSLVCLLAYLNCLSRLPASVPWLTSLPHYCTYVLSVHITRNLL